ncbi:hypothetical protein [Candidatus Thiosymbion oneisti]|uniref:hypothetical protein n=1 Tax=Candidatus Thiosymbion oneisti TaxID=589554 RepID=UPI0010618FC0|nr:hypothetical protein [Candidatus Thiosymbion oneisti]
MADGYDAALAILSQDVQSSPAVFEQPNTKLGNFTEPSLGMKVAKYGVRTRFTRGIVDGIEGSFAVPYGERPEDRFWMSGIRITVDPKHPPDGNEISLRGDSGSVWYNIETSEIVALHFAGEDNITLQYEYSLAHPITRIASLLEFEP